MGNHILGVNPIQYGQMAAILVGGLRIYMLYICRRYSPGVASAVGFDDGIRT